MLRVNLKEIIDFYGLNINQLSKKTGISRKALTSLVNYNDLESPPVSLQYATIDALCTFFNIGVNDLISYEYSQDQFSVLPIMFNAGKNRDIALYIYIYKKNINQVEQSSYFIVAIKLTDKIEGKEQIFKVPKAIWGDFDSNNFETEKRVMKMPDRLTFDYEIIDYDSLDVVDKYLTTSPLASLFSNGSLIPLKNQEINTLMNSFRKTFLAELTARTFDDLLSEESENSEIVVNWNLGELSWLNSGKFHFEYSKNADTIVSMDSDLPAFKKPFFDKIDDSQVKPNTHSLL